MTTEQNHWNFFNLPPFFTLQPGATALVRQVSLWGSVIMDHAAYHAPNTKEGICPFLRLYKDTSDVFRNPSLNRRLQPEAAKLMLESLATQQPNHCIIVSSGNDDDKRFALLVACNVGGLKAIEESLLSWLLDRGVGTTTAHLAQKGAVMTFDELAQSNCLKYKREKEPFLKRLSTVSVTIDDAGMLTNEQAIRVFLQAIRTRPTSAFRAVHITFFNLDGSEREPYEGVKFGGVIAS